MADLRTTAEERAALHKSAQFNMWLPGSATLTMQALDDLDTLLAENARLLAVAEAAKELLSESQRAGCGCLSQFPCPRCDAERDVSTALAALEAP